MIRGWVIFFSLLAGVMLLVAILIPAILKSKDMPIKWGFMYWIFAGFAIFILVFLIFLNASWGNFSTTLDQKMLAKVVHKQEILIGQQRYAAYSYIVTFEFPDSSSVKLDVKSVDVFDSIQEGDKGFLTYKEKEKLKGPLEIFFNDFSNKLFISFEKDG